MSSQPRSKQTARSTILFVLTTLISLACLGYALQHFNVPAFSNEFRRMHWGWVLVAVVTDILVYVVQGWRWSLVLKPVQPVPAWQCIRAIYVGLFANEVLPFRTGEVIRCYLQTRWTGLPLAFIVATAVVERIFDGIWLMVLLFLSVRYVQLPAHIVQLSSVLGVLILLAIVVLGSAMWVRSRPGHDKLQKRSFQRLNLLLDELYAIGHSRYLYYAFLASLPHLLMQIAPIYALIRAYGLGLSLGAASVVMVVLRMGSVIPGLPGNLGTFQLSTIAALTIFGVEAGRAARFSFVMWTAITLPLLLAGFVALLVTGFRLGELRREAQSSMQPTAQR